MPNPALLFEIQFVRGAALDAHPLPSFQRVLQAAVAVDDQQQRGYQSTLLQIVDDRGPGRRRFGDRETQAHDAFCPVPVTPSAASTGTEATRFAKRTFK